MPPSALRGAPIAWGARFVQTGWLRIGGSDGPASPDLSLVIPAYNERARLPATLREAAAYFGEVRREAGGDELCKIEFLVIDDGSTDGTARVAETTLRGARHPYVVFRHPENRGKGRAVRLGMLRARGRRCLVLDADGSTPIAEWEKLRDRLDAGADIVVGSRAMRDSRIPARQPWYRRPLGPCFNALVRALLFRGIRDTQCGFKAYRTDVARDLFARQRSESFTFDPEILFLALRTGCRVEEVGVLWRDRADSKVSVPRDATRMLRDLIRVRWHAAWGLYDCTFGAGSSIEVGSRAHGARDLRHLASPGGADL